MTDTKCKIRLIHLGFTWKGKNGMTNKGWWGEGRSPMYGNYDKFHTLTKKPKDRHFSWLEVFEVYSWRRQNYWVFVWAQIWLEPNSSRGERILFFGPNTNTNNIRNQILDQIRIRIIFVFSEWANTNTNNIRAQIFGRIQIRIIFGFRIVPEYEYE